MEQLCHKTAKNPNPKYEGFDKKFYKFPSYLRRGAINEAVGKVSSYQSNFANWERADFLREEESRLLPKQDMYIRVCIKRECTSRRILMKQK